LFWQVIKLKIILLGAPGSGKGTQAGLLYEKLGIPHISTGEIFRNHIKNNTRLGQKAGEYMKAGQLVPDELTCEMLFERLEEEDCKNGFILDGFPRTINQAEALDRYFKEKGQEIDKVINIIFPDEEVIRRIGARRVCSNCSATYNLDYDKPADELCTVCRSPLIQRKDDSPEIVKARLVTYHEMTEPLIKYYKKSGKFVAVDGILGKWNVNKVIMRILG
jgi:adenylate kinase